MQAATLIDPRLEIAETLFEARAEIRYALAMPITNHLLNSVQRDRLERLLSDMEDIQSEFDALRR